MPAKMIKELLNKHRTKYVTITHSPAFTAQEVAESAHIRGIEMVKTVVVKLDGMLAMAAVPSTFHVNLKALAAVTGAKEAKLATEDEFRGRFPGCELGAMPPFGNLYNLEVYADRRLAEDQEIAFNSGTHTEVIRMAYADFERLVKPTVVDMTA
jgi:Ala-tRNA(Pro) deacylase